MEYLKVKNWTKFQHYKARNPPWIKLYRSMLADYEFCALSDTSKCHLMLIWLEAANRDGAVPHDANFLRRRLSLKSNPDLNTLINSGWLIKTLAPYASTTSEKNRIEKRREETSTPADSLKPQPRRKISDSLPAFLSKKSTDLTP